MDKTLAIILSSTVISALITMIFNLITNHKRNQIENITQERKNWRESIREIAFAIAQTNDLGKLKQLLSKLKVRINANGINNHNNYSNDGHIWAIIKRIECIQEDESDYKEVGTLKDRLIDCLSCLLKRDWERSKREIQGNNVLNFYIFIYITSVAIYILNSVIKNTTLNLNTILCAFIVFIIAFGVFYIINSLSDKFIHKSSIPGMLLYVIVIMSIYFALMVMIALLVAVKDDSFTFFIAIPTIVYLLSSITTCIKLEWKKILYRDTINKIIKADSKFTIYDLLKILRFIFLYCILF